MGTLQSVSLPCHRPGAGCDHSLEGIVTRALRSSGYGPLRDLDCRIREGEVVLSGVVSSFFLKQMAQAIVLRLERVERVRNLIEVRRTQGESAPPASGETR
jgi:hypothetical protein